MRTYRLLPDHTVVECPLEEWSLADFSGRVVQQTRVGPWWVSTVFLGLDHNWEPGGPPHIFETMIFWRGIADAPLDEEYTERYSTWDEAVAGHARALGYVTVKEEKGVGNRTRE